MVSAEIKGYAGDKTPIEAWNILKSDNHAILIDVRSLAEWTYVGVTDLTSIGKEAYAIEWKSFPNMIINANFVDQVKEICMDPETKILSLCRSGQRSVSSSRALTHAGFKQCYNVLEGFEGDKDKNEHRSQSGGWKFHGLPWKQN